jgi:hypothetical protein
MGDAVLATTTRANQIEMVVGSLTPFDWFFTVSNFVRWVLIPSFCRESLGFDRPISDQASDELLVVMLEDSEYLDHLRQVILFHAVGDRMALAQPLRSGHSGIQIREGLRPCLEKVTLHGDLRKFQADLKTKRKLDSRQAPEFIKWAQGEAAGIT